MKKNKLIRKTRKWHRYLGLLLGVQFLLWTLGGLYFSWTNIDEIRGDHLKKKSKVFAANSNYISPSLFLKKLSPTENILSLELKMILEEPHYEVVYLKNDIEKVYLVNAISGTIRNPLNKEEAIQVSNNKLKVPAPIQDIEHLTNAGNHHEYRGKPLPAFAITYGEPANTTVYVSQTYGNVQTLRSTKWRIFDFLWMLHTMDYKERDNFNNILLRAFSLFGIFTILSGFMLFALTSKTFNTKKRKK